MQKSIYPIDRTVLAKKVFRISLRCSLFVGLIAFIGFALDVRAVSPAPDGGYVGGNTAEGEDALFSLQSNHFGNTAVGNHSLHDNASGNFNTAVGFLAMETAQSGTANTALGNRALHSNKADHNTACGANAMELNTSG